MWSSSQEFASLMKRSHTYSSKVEVWNDSVLIASTETADFGLSLVGGSVTVDRRSQTRRTFSFKMLAKDRATYAKYLDPLLGYDLRPYRGAVLSNGTIEWIPLGVFKFDTTNVRNIEGTITTVEGSAYDRASIIARNVWSTTYRVPSGTNQATAIVNIASNRATGFTLTSIVQTSTTAVTPELNYNPQDDPAAAMTTLAEGIACEWYFDQLGYLNIVPTPDPTTGTPTLDLSSGSSAVRIGDLQETYSIQDTKNGVIVRGSAPWLLFPVSGEAWDDDPFSPTYRYGPFGQRPIIVDDPVVADATACTNAAKAKLSKIVGISQEIRFNVLPDPRLDVGDIVAVYNSDTKWLSYYVLDQLSIPLFAGSITGTTRRVKSTRTA